MSCDKGLFVRRADFAGRSVSLAGDHHGVRTQLSQVLAISRCAALSCMELAQQRSATAPLRTSKGGCCVQACVALVTAAQSCVPGAVHISILPRLRVALAYNTRVITEHAVYAAGLLTVPMQAACLWLKYTSLLITPSSLRRYAPVLLTPLLIGPSVSCLFCYRGALLLSSSTLRAQLAKRLEYACEASSRRTCGGLHCVLGSINLQAAASPPGNHQPKVLYCICRR